jgi:predicted nucleic acid-binding protein
MYILDTNTMSELRKSRMQRADPQVAAWAATTDLREHYLSAITIQELEIGTLRAERIDPRKGLILRSWMTKYILHHFRERILPVDAQVALRSAVLHNQRSRPIGDALIAATAYVHGMSVVTRNVRDFQDTGVDVINPWEWQ